MRSQIQSSIENGTSECFASLSTTATATTTTNIAKIMSTCRSCAACTPVHCANQREVGSSAAQVFAQHDYGLRPFLQQRHLIQHQMLNIHQDPI